jgi:pimeloyl-ACP methyl ester carboxylesterase
MGERHQSQPHSAHQLAHVFFIQSPLIPAHSRPKDGVLSHAYAGIQFFFGIALSPRFRGDDRRSTRYVTEMTASNATGEEMNEMSKPAAAIKGEDHWTTKNDGVKLFLFEKCAGDPAKTMGTILFVHGSSMASQPTFDLQVPGRPDSSAMDHFARRGYDCWCVDMEGYGRSTKNRDNNAPISQGADDCYAAALYIQKLRGKRPFLVYGISSGALRAAMFAERHPEMVARLALDAMVWTGEGSPTLEQRRKKLPEFQAKNRRPIDKAFIHSVFDRDHPDTAERKVIEAFADAVTALDDSVPTGTYVDMCSKLPVVNPEKITVPTLIMRGQHDGIASMDDLLKFYAKLANPDKQFTVMPGISHASFQQKNYMVVYHILASFFAQPEPVYIG